LDNAVPPAKLSDLRKYFGNVISILIGAGGIVLFVMIIIGGFLYLTAGGNPQQAESARKTITSAIIGIVILAMAYLIIQLIGNFTGTNLTNFSIIGGQ